MGQVYQSSSAASVADNHSAGSLETTMRPTDYSDRDADIVSIARQASNTGEITALSDKLFKYEKNSPLDPFGVDFNPRLWVRMMSHVSRQSKAQRLSGMSYRDLSVHGFGSDAGQRYSSAIRARAEGQITRRLSRICRCHGLARLGTGSRTGNAKYRSSINSMEYWKPERCSLSSVRPGGKLGWFG